MRCWRARAGERGDEARALLVNPPAYGEACAALMAQLAQSGQFNRTTCWRSCAWPAKCATGPSRRIALLLGASDTRAAQAVDVPALAMARGIGSTRAEHEIYLVALGRMARTSLKLATVALDKNSSKLSPTSARSAGRTWRWPPRSCWRRKPTELLAARRRRAADQLPARMEEPASRCAAATGSGAATIDAMPARCATNPAGPTGWAAPTPTRAGAKMPTPCTAASPPEQFLWPAGDGRTGPAGDDSAAAAPPTPAELAPGGAIAGPSARPEILRAAPAPEGTREWNWALRDLTERQLLAAAEYARRNDILDRMVNTSLRTRTELDYTQRFPAPHNDILQPTAQGLGLDTAWVYGLIRQESRFITDARSGVGASGLMQVMPATGKWVAARSA
jgi:soluble lytic murein transglycosylase